MKHCNSCNQDLPLDSFGKWTKSKDGLYYKCKDCRRAYDKAHYKNNPQRRQLVREVDQRNRLVNRERVIELKKNGKCFDCGLRNWIVLEFDHLRDKEFNISDMIRHSRSWKSIQLEIDKCDLVCANCHRIRTYNRRNGLEV